MLIDHPAVCKFGADAELIEAEIEGALEPLLDGEFPWGRHDGVVQDESVERKAVRKAADLSEEGAAAPGRHVKALREGERPRTAVDVPPVELGDLYGVRYGAEHGFRLPAGNVTPQTDTHPEIEIPAHRCDTRGEVHVGVWTVRDPYAVFQEAPNLLIGGVDTVRHDGARLVAEQTVAVIAVAVEAGIRHELFDKLHLARIFGQVRLYRQVIGPAYLAQLAEQTVAAAGDETGRQDRLCAPVIPFCGRVHKSEGVKGGEVGGRLSERRRRVPVHVDLADIADYPRLLHQIHEQQRRLPVYRPEDHGPGGGALSHLPGENSVGSGGVVGIGVPGLLREREARQPIQQLAVHPGPAVSKL